MSRFERVERRRTQQGEPYLRITPENQSSYLSVAAIREFFEDVERVEFHVDQDRSLVALVESDSDQSYSLSSKSGGAQVAVRQALRELGVDQEDVEDPIRCPVREDPESGYVVADLKEVIETLTEDVHCPECGGRYTESGLKTHFTKKHDEDWAGSVLEEADPDDVGEPFPDVEEVRV